MADDQKRPTYEKLLDQRKYYSSHQYLLDWRCIGEAYCQKCSGAGRITYGSTATWHRGAGGQMLTAGVCNKCWGSGTVQPWPSHREFAAMKKKADDG